MKCFLCRGEKLGVDLITRPEGIQVCRPCFDDAMNGDFNGIETRRDLEQLKVQVLS